jgi:hypothetical protein
MDDNAVIYDYIKRKVDAGENFIIRAFPDRKQRGGSHETVFRRENANPEILSYLKRVMPVMKKNAGIK